MVRKLDIDKDKLNEMGNKLAELADSPEIKKAMEEAEHLEKHHTKITGPMVVMRTDTDTRSKMNFVRKPEYKNDRDAGLYSLAILVEIGISKDMMYWEPSQSVQYRPKLIHSNTKGHFIKVGGKNIYLNDSHQMIEYAYDMIADSEDMEQFDCPREAFDKYLTYVRELEK